MHESRISAPDGSDAWFVCQNARPEARLRLYSFPYAGGGASLFTSWPDYLPALVELVPMQLPGRENHWTEDRFTQIQPLVETLVEILEPHLNAPFALFGHSMGALIGFELARELRRQAKPAPVHLFISAARAPQLPNPDPPIANLPDTEFLQEVERRYGAVDKLPENSELRQLVVPVLRADFSICEGYEYSNEAPLDCPISVFGGLADQKATRGELAGWVVQTCSTFNLRVFPGGHFFIQSSKEPFLRVLSEQLYQTARRLRRRP